VSAIQLREKDLSLAELVELARPIVKLCHTYNAQVFINSHIEAALTLGADGVHLPASTPPIPEVIAPINDCLIVGCSTHTTDEAKRREAEGANFVAYSPVYPTVSKPGYGPAVGLEGLREVTRQVHIPVFALGGVTPERVKECLDAGAFGVAVMSGLMTPGVGVQQALAYLQQLRNYTGNRE
jgi:thiamine-phosphate pyrophosphorylase